MVNRYWRRRRRLVDPMSKKVLIIEDDKPLSEILADQLSMHDIETVQAANGIQGIEMAESEKPDLILLDLLMPIMDGEEAYDRMKDKGLLKDCGVIVLTNYGGQEKMRKFKEEGIRYLVKSNLKIKEIIGTCLEVLGLKE